MRQLAASSYAFRRPTTGRPLDLRLTSGLLHNPCTHCLSQGAVMQAITRLAAGLRHPGRVLGMHFFNPAPLMALVEVVCGLDSDPQLASCLFETARAWGKQPVHARSTPGFIVNRVARPFYAESLRLLQEGAADC
eukprot:gene6700-8337_t